MEYNEDDFGPETLIELVEEKESEGTSKIFKWADKPTKLFFDLYRLYNEKYCKRELKTQKKIFEEISNSMQKEGYDVSTSIVENKFKWCRRKYSLLRRRLAAGHRRINVSIDLQNTLEEMFGKKHSSNPVALFNSISGIYIRSQKSGGNEDSLNHENLSHQSDHFSVRVSDDENSRMDSNLPNHFPVKSVKKQKHTDGAQILQRLEHTLTRYMNETCKRHERRDKFERALLDLYEREIQNAAKFRADLLRILKSEI